MGVIIYYKYIINITYQVKMCKKIRLFSQFRRHLAYHPPKPHLNPFIFRIRVPPWSDY